MIFRVYRINKLNELINLKKLKINKNIKIKIINFYLLIISFINN